MNKDSKLENMSENVPEESINIREMVNKFISLWPWALCSCVLFLLIAFIYLHFITPSYHVNASILIKKSSTDSRSGESGTVPMLNLGFGNSSVNVNSEIRILKSYALLRRVVEETQGNVLYSKEENFRFVGVEAENLPFKANFSAFHEDTLQKEGTLYYQLDIKKDQTGFSLKNEDTGEKYESAWYDTLNLQAGKVAFLPNPNFKGESEKTYRIAVRPLRQAVGALLGSLSITVPDRQANIVRLSLVTQLPQKGENELDALIKEYMRETVKTNSQITDSTIAFIDRRLVVVSKQLSDIEGQIQSFKQENKIADLGSQSQSLVQSSNEYAKEIASKQIKLNLIASLQDYLEKNKNNPRIVPASLMLENSTLSGIISQYNELLLQRSQLLVNATEDNPSVQNIDQRLAILREDLKNSVNSIKRTTETTLNSIENQLGSLQNKITSVPVKERVFLDYSRKQEVLQQLYLFLLKRREETAISKSTSLANAQIINAARSDNAPFSPKKKVIYLAFLIIGAIIPFGFTYLRDLFNTRLASKKDIEGETTLPIVGEIGHKKLEGRVVVGAESRSVISEQFRALRTNLQFLLPYSNNKILLSTSSMGGEGKSFITLNLAMSLAITNKKVLLMEMDLRKPKIVAPLGIKVKNGFSGYVVRKAEIEDIIYDSGLHENLKIIPAGAVPPNPVELLLNERTEELMNYLRDTYDYVFIDAPPLLVTDAQVMAKYADSTLYIVRIGKTRKEQLRIPEELKRSKKIPNLNLVVNDIKVNKYSGGYYGYGKGYGGYGYGDYIKEEKSKRKFFLK